MLINCGLRALVAPLATVEPTGATRSSFYLLDPEAFTLPPNSDQLIEIETGDQPAIDGSDVHQRIAELELELDALADTVEGCRKTIMLAKLAVMAGGTLLAIGFLRSDAVLGGL